MTPWNVVAADGALIAFLLGFYTLVGNARKAPYVINTIISVFLLCLIGATICLASNGLPVKPATNTISIWLVSFTFSPPSQDSALNLAVAIIALAFLISIYRVYKISLKFNHFVDNVSWKYFPVVRDVRRLRARYQQNRTYAHDPLQIPEEARVEVFEYLRSVKAEIRRSSDARSIAIRSNHLDQASSVMAGLAVIFLRHGLTVQYLTASRHPIDFIEALKKECEDGKLDWVDVAQRVVVIDAYTPHFAFLDSIYPRKTGDLAKLGVDCVTAGMSFAGVHTAAARAFNLLKKKASTPKRSATLVIYEDPFALADLESPELYRVFVRHVLPSERLWGGMFTVVVESSQGDNDWRVLQSYADIVLAMEPKAVEA